MKRKTMKVIFTIIVINIMSIGVIPADAYKIMSLPGHFEDDLGNGLRLSVDLNVSSFYFWYNENFTITFDFSEGDGWYWEKGNVSCHLYFIEIQLDLGNYGQFNLIQDFLWEEIYEFYEYEHGSKAIFNRFFKNYTISINTSPPFLDGSRVEANLLWRAEFRWDVTFEDQNELSLFRVSNYLPGGNSAFTPKEFHIIVNDFSKIRFWLDFIGGLNVFCLIIFMILELIRLKYNSPRIGNITILVEALTLIISGVLNTLILTVTLGLMELSSGFSYSFESRGVLIGIFTAAVIAYLILLVKNLKRDYSIDSVDFVGYEESLLLAGVSISDTSKNWTGFEEKQIGSSSVESIKLRRISILQPMVFTIWIEMVCILILDFFWGGLVNHWAVMISILTYTLAFSVISLDLYGRYKYRLSRLRIWRSIWSFYYAVINEKDKQLEFLGLRETNGLNEKQLSSLIKELEDYFGSDIEKCPIEENTPIYLANGLAFKWIIDNIIDSKNEIPKELVSLKLFRNKIVYLLCNSKTPWVIRQNNLLDYWLKLAVWMKFALDVYDERIFLIVDADKIIQQAVLPLEFKSRIVMHYHRFHNDFSMSIFPEFDEWTAVILGISTTLGGVIGPLFSELIGKFI